MKEVSTNGLWKNITLSVMSTLAILIPLMGIFENINQYINSMLILLFVFLSSVIFSMISLMIFTDMLLIQYDIYVKDKRPNSKFIIRRIITIIIWSITFLFIADYGFNSSIYHLHPLVKLIYGVLIYYVGLIFYVLTSVLLLI